MPAKEITAYLGKEFYPFKGLKELIPPDTPEVFGTSKAFHLTGYGRGYINLLNESDFAYKGGNLITLNKGKVQVTKLPSSLVLFTVYMTPSSLLTKQPPLWCTVKAGDAELVGPNLGFTDEEPLDEGIFFYYFGPRKSSGYKDLVVPSTLAFLRQMRLRFDLRHPQNPSGY